MTDRDDGGWEVEAIDEESAATAARFFHSRLEDTFSATFPPEALRTYRREYREEAVREQVEAGDRVMLQATADGKVLGVMFGGPPDGGLAYVVWIAVHPEERGKGIGQDLMEGTFARYREMGVHKVALYTETLEARGFYESVGMELEGTHPEHWWGLDHYCLARKLQPYRSPSGNGKSNSPVERDDDETNE